MRLHLLGPVELVRLDGAPLPDVTRQIRLMLACLALAGPKGLTRSELCTLFWPDRPSGQARNSLRQCLAAIRKLLPSDGPGAGTVTLESDLEAVRLSSTPGAIDVDVFRLGAAADDRCAQVAAAQAWRGEPLSGLDVPDGAHAFALTYRRNLTDTALQLAERLSRADASDVEALDAAQALALRLLKHAPAAEEAHRALMRVHLARGSVNAALRQFERCKQALMEELQVTPDIVTQRIAASAGVARQEHIVAPPSAVQTAPSETDVALVRHGPSPSVAILPFDNLGDASDDYVADGVVEEITAALSRIRDFFVIARQSAFTFKGRFVDVRDIGRELGVAYLVEGTVRRGGNRLRISVQLVEAASRNQLWSNRFEGDADEIFDFQDRIAAQVAGAIKPEIRRAEIEAACRKPPANLQAYDLVMRAFPKLWGQNAKAISEAIPILQAAIQADPHYGRALALLAWCYALRLTYLWTTEVDREVNEVRELVDKALGLIDDDPTALTAAGAAAGLCGDQEGASTLLQRALALDPNNAWAWARYGWSAIYRGQAELAAERFDNATTLSPLDPFGFNMRIGKAAALAHVGRFREATAIAKEETKRHPDVTWAYRLLAAWSALAGDMSTAQSAARRLMAAQPDFTIKRYLEVPAFSSIPQYRELTAKGLRAAGLPDE